MHFAYSAFSAKLPTTFHTERKDSFILYQQRRNTMATKLKQHFPIIRERAEVLAEIGKDTALQDKFDKAIKFV